MTASARRVCALSGAMIFLAGCGGGSAVPRPPTGAGASQSSARIPASVVITIPKATASASRRRPKYLSPATQSVTIDVTGPTSTSITAGLTPTSSGCSSTLASTQCTLQLSLAPGSYTGSIATFDGTNGTGAVLSANQAFMFAIAAGQANRISFVLNGIPHQIVVLPLNASLKQTGAAAYTITGMFPSPVEAAALDADGNVITGQGAPTFSIAQTSGSAYTLQQPVQTSPNTLTMFPPAGEGASASFSVTADFGDGGTICASPGAVCSTTFTTTTHQQTLAAFGTDPLTGSSVVDIVPWPYTGTQSVLPSQRNAGGGFDRAGNLFMVSDNGSIEEFAPPYTGMPARTITPADAVTWLTVAPDGTLLVGNQGGVDVYAPPYTSAPAQITAYPYVNNGVVDSTGNYFGQAQNIKIFEISPPYTSAVLAVQTYFGLMVTAAAGDVFFGGNAIGAPPFPQDYAQPFDGTSGGIGVESDGTTVVVSDGSGLSSFTPPYDSGTRISSNAALANAQSVTLDEANDVIVFFNSGTTFAAPAPYTTSSAFTVPGGSRFLFSP